MSDWGTAVQMVTERVHRYGTADPDIVKRGLCYSIGRRNEEDYFFNEDTKDVSTVAGQFAYDVETGAGAGDGYPIDLIKFKELSLQTSNTWYPIRNIAIRRFRKEQVSSSYRGYPEEWCWFNKQLLLSPNPNGAYTVRVDYTKDIGTPIAAYSSSVWAFTVGGVTLTDTYTNDWFEEGLYLITNEACYWIFSQILGDTEQAGLALREVDDQVDHLYIRSQASNVPREARPWV